jgi:hypothetical protein
MPKRLKYKYHHVDMLPALPSDHVFVFGSNLAGLHSVDIPLIASTSYGAEFGVGVGVTGGSYCIPIKDRFIRFLTLKEIKIYVDQFKAHTLANPDTKFWVTHLGIERRGYSHHDIAPLFRGCGPNCNFPLQWRPYLK